MRAREKESVQREFAERILNVLDTKCKATLQQGVHTHFADLRKHLGRKFEGQMPPMEIVARAINRVLPDGDVEALAAYRAHDRIGREMVEEPKPVDTAAGVGAREGWPG